MPQSDQPAAIIFKFSYKFIFTNQTMKQITALLFLFSISLFSFSQPKNAQLTESRGRPADKFSGNKQEVLVSVEKHQQELIQLSDQVWAFAETALKETQSSKVLADYAAAQGFKVTRGVAEMPTAFIAEYGSGKPIIGVLGEFDALPGLSQKAQPLKEALRDGAPGHGCGHNLFGAGSLGAAVSIKELIAAGKLKGTIRFYGTPAEEDLAGKVYMARAGLFNDLDICLDWHPDYENKANMQSSQAVTDYSIHLKARVHMLLLIRGMAIVHWMQQNYLLPE